MGSSHLEKYLDQVRTIISNNKDEHIINHDMFDEKREFLKKLNSNFFIKTF